MKNGTQMIMILANFISVYQYNQCSIIYLGKMSIE